MILKYNSVGWKTHTLKHIKLALTPINEELIQNYLKVYYFTKEIFYINFITNNTWKS